MINGEKRHLFLAVDCRAKGVAGIDRTFWGFARETPDFLIGCEEYWGDELEDKIAEMERKQYELDFPAKELDPPEPGALNPADLYEGASSSESANEQDPLEMLHVRKRGRRM